MKEAMRATSIEHADPAPAVVEPAGPMEMPEAGPDLQAIAAMVASQQAVEPRVHRVAAASDAWNALAARSVGGGLRSLDTEGRSRRLFDAARLEPTHLTPLSMTAAAGLALRTGEVAPFRMRASSLHHDPRAIPGLDKAGLMIGVAFTGPGSIHIEPTDNPNEVVLSGIQLISHAYLYDALLIRIPTSSGGATCYLLPVHIAPGYSNHLRVKKLFGRPGTAPATFARVEIDGGRAIRVGPEGAGDRLFRPVVERLRADSAVVGAAQMRAAVDALTGGLEARTGPDVFHRQFVEDIEVTVAENMAVQASDRLSLDGVGGLPLVIAQHWIRSRFGAIVPDASALMHLDAVPVSPAVAWTSPLLPLWGGTAPVLKTEFVTWAERGALAPFLERCRFQSESSVLRQARDWLLQVAEDDTAPPIERLEAAALTWAASILWEARRQDALAVLLGAEAAPRARSRRSGGRRPSAGAEPARRSPTSRPVETSSSSATDRDLVIDLREGSGDRVTDRVESPPV